MPFGQPVSGTDGRIKIGGVSLRLRKWSVEPQVQYHDTTNAEGSRLTAADPDGRIPYSINLGNGKVSWGRPGFATGAVSLQSADVQITGFWDASQNPHANPPNLVAGAQVGPCLLYVSQTMNLYWNFPWLLCVSVPVTCEVDGVVEITANFKSEGDFAYPGSPLSGPRDANPPAPS